MFDFATQPWPSLLDLATKADAVTILCSAGVITPQAEQALLKRLAAEATGRTGDDPDFIAIMGHHVEPWSLVSDGRADHTAVTALVTWAADQCGGSPQGWFDQIASWLDKLPQPGDVAVLNAGQRNLVVVATRPKDKA